MVNPYLRTLNKRLADGRLNEITYANMLKNYYDSNAGLLDEDSLQFVESKLTELKVPIENPDATDGVIKHALSGLLEGFTTFGFADKPDTPIEKIVSNVGHLIGLAPGIMMGGARMLTSATATVGNALIRRGSLEKSKDLISLGKKLNEKSRTYSKSSDRLQRAIGRMADKMSFTDEAGKLQLGLRASRPSMIDSNHPLATRNEGGMSLQGVKDMAMAGVHGGMAGAIFGTIGQYANISKLMTSSNPALVKTGENLVRKTAKSLVSTNQEATEFVNTIVRATAGASYGTAISMMNDYPVEEQIYETLMGMFFSVNARPTWQTKATRDINIHANKFNRTKSVNENVEILKQQPWFQAESKDYQQYWLNHFEAIRNQQIASKEVISAEVSREILKQVKQLEKEGIVTQEQIQSVLKGKSSEEGKLSLLQELVTMKELLADPDYSPSVKIEEYVASRNIDLTALTEMSNFKNEVTPGNEVDFPIHSLTELQKRISGTSAYKDVTPDTFFGSMVDVYNRTKNKHFFTDNEGNKRINIDKFIEAVKRKYNQTKFENSDIKETRRVGLRFDVYKPVKNDFYIDFTDPIKKGEERFIGDPRRVPAQDPQGNDIKKLTSGRRDNFKGFRYMSGNTISYMAVNSRGGVIFVSPFARNTIFNKDGSVVVTPYVKESQWLAFEKKLNEKRKFIYGGIADTGRVEVRSYPWAPKGKSNHWNTQVVNQVYKKIIDNVMKNDKAKEFYEKNVKKNSINNETKANTVATMIYRMREMGMITTQSQITQKNIQLLIPEYLKNERTGDYKTPAKLQKYMNQIDKAEIPFIDGKSLGLKDDNLRGMLLKDLNTGPRESETDGTILLHSKIFDKLVKYMGNDSASGMAKGTLYSRPRSKSESAKNDKGNKALIIGKYAYARADAADVKYMNRNGVDFILYDTGAKHRHGLKINELNEKAYDPSKSTAEQVGVYPENPETFRIKTSEMNWNIDVREKINVTGKLNIMQQMFLNANNIQFDPATPVGKSFHEGWRELIGEGISGDPKVTKEALKRLKSSKKNPNGRSLKGLDIDKIDIKTLDMIMSERTKSEAFKSILEHLYYENKHGRLIDSEQSEFSMVNDMHVGQHLRNAGFSYSALQSRGTSEFVQKTFRSYIMSRIIRPQVNNSYSVILGPYDWKYSLKKQKYSSAKKGLADNEFMLWSGAKEMRVKHPVTKQEMRLGDWWETMKLVIDFNPAYSDRFSIKVGDPGQQTLRFNRKAPKEIRDMSASDLNAWIDSQYAIINRSPVMTAGNMRALKFVGFAGGKGDKGFALITNSRNDLMMGGADKDIDSAHLSWGMPKKIKDGYRQQEVMYEFAKDFNNPKEDYELKDDAFLQELGILPKDIIAKDNPLGILMLSEKIKAADSATYGKNSIGVIFNGFTQIKQAVDIHFQTVKGMSRAEKLKIYQEIARLNAAIGNRYIDAAETVGLPDAFTTMKKVREYLYNEYDLPVNKLGMGNLFAKFNTATIKGKLGQGMTYEEISQRMIEKHGDVDTITKQIAEYSRDLKLEIDPLVGFQKENIFQVVELMNKALAKDPYAEAFGIKNDQYWENLWWNSDTITKQERQAIMDNPHFLYNKMSVVRVVKAVQETYNFLDKQHKFKDASGKVEAEMTIPEILQMRLGMNRSQVDSFTFPKSEKALIEREIERLFEFWHEANPIIELNYNRMPEVQKAEFEKRKQEFTRVKNQIKNLKLYVHGDKNNRRKGKQDPNNVDSWFKKRNPKTGNTDAQDYFNLQKQFRRYEYEMRNFQDKGINNMMRNGAISSRTLKEIAKFEEQVLESLQPKTDAGRKRKLFDFLDIAEPVKIKDPDGPGTVIDTDVKFTGKFAAQLINWEALSKADNFKKTINEMIVDKDTEIAKYKMTPPELTKELDRMGDIVFRMMKHGQTANVMDLTGIYLKTFEKLDVVAKSDIDMIDFNHLRVLNNMLENRYLDGWKEWGARKTIHKKLAKEMEQLEKEHGSKLMPPEFDTDLLFPSELGKVLEKVDKVYSIGTAQVVKDGVFQEVGIRYPTSTVSSIAESIGRAHTAGNTLYEAMEKEFNARLDFIRPKDVKAYNKIKSTIESLAAFERQMGIKGDGPIPRQGPRETEHDISIKNLTENVRRYRKLLSQIDPDLRIQVVSRADGKTRDFTPRELVEYMKENIQTETMTDAFETLHASNWKELKQILSGKQLAKAGFKGGVFDFNKFYKIEKENAYKPEQPEYMHQAMSEMFMDKYGIIVPERIMFIEQLNLSDRSLAEGKRVLRKHFHSEDLTWIEFQLDILDIAIERYGTIKKDGSIGLDYNKLANTPGESKNRTQLEELTNFVRESNLNKVQDQRIGFIGTEEIDGTRFSNTYHPLHHPKTKAHIEFLQDVHIPQETLRYFGKLRNTKTGETYTDISEVDIKAFRRGEIQGIYDSKNGITKNQLFQESLELHRQVEQGFITMPEAANALYRNMVNKLVNSPEQYNNDFYDQISYDRVNMLSTRRGTIETPGVGKFSTIRRRAAIPVEGYDSSLEAYRRYLKTSSLGVTSQRAALIARLHIRNFKNNTLPGNKRIDPEVGRKWTNKIIDITRGYMNMPSTRNFELHGITERDMNILDQYAKSGYSLHFIKENPQYDIVDAKLINDFRQYTRPSEAEVSNLQKLLYNKYRFDSTEKTRQRLLTKVDDNKKLSAKAKNKAKKKINDKFNNEVKNKQKKMLKELYGEYKSSKTGKIIKRDNIAHIDYAENLITMQNGTVIKYNKDASVDGAIRKRVLQNRRDFLYKTNEKGNRVINKDNIDITNIRKSFRHFYSEEALGNTMLRAEARINKALGYLTDGQIQIFKRLPNDPSARHRAMVEKMNWFSDMEGKFEMMSLLAHPKSAVANAYGGTTNLITDVGFDFYFKTFDEAYLVNEVFRGKKYQKWDTQKGKFVDRDIQTMEDVHGYIESFGFIENNITRELAMLQPASAVDWQGFVNVVGPRIAEGFRKLPVYTGSKEVNKKNQEARKQIIEENLTITEASKKFGINKKLLDIGSSFMSVTERHLRIKSALAHYIKGRELFTDSRGQVEVSEQFLLEYAQKGISATQFIYHATNRPNFANTAFGRVMTRFHPYSWSSIRRRADIITDRMITEGYGDFEANKRFERQLSADLMVSALGSIFAASIFEYALSPPMNWAVDFSHLMFGSEEQKERAFYNQYGHPLLSPLAIVTPPAARFVLGPTTSIINGDWEAFAKYTAATAFPFGRFGRDIVRTAETPEMFMEWIFGVPIHQLGRLGNRPEPEVEETEIDAVGE
jgi:hypothetical protein